MTIDIDLNDNNLDQKFKPVRKNESRKSKKLREKSLKKEKTISLLTPDEKKKKRKKKKIIIFVVLFLLFFGLGFLIYKGYIFSHDFGFRFQPGSLITRDKKELKTDSSGNFTNVLLVGLDTRENGGLLNTDTIIMASYNHQTHNITLLSIPRDFHVEAAKDLSWYVRINSIYSSAEQKDKDSGITELEKSVERLTGQEIQYYAIVDFNAFVEIIDAIGGIDINVENSFTDYRYPLGKNFQTVSFVAGPQTMDGETALKYSRSRLSLQNSEGSDFARARRQQKVILALKDKLLSTESLTNPRTLLGILSSVAGNIRVSEFSTKDIEAAINLSKEFDEEGGKTYSFVLDPTVGNSLLVEKKYLESGAYAIGPKLGFAKYDDIHEFVDLLMTSPKMHNENPRVLVYDTGAGNSNARKMTEQLKEEYPYINISFSGTLRSDKDDIVIYSKQQEDEESEEFPYTVSKISKFLKTELTQKPEYITTNLNGEDVTILLGSNLQLMEEI